MGGSSIDFDTVLDLCRDKHRRITLAVLADQQQSLSLTDLTKAIVKHNHDTPLTEVSDETVTRIRITLYHIHIPKLVEAGLVEYDSQRQLVEPTMQFDQIEPLLSPILDADSELPYHPDSNTG